MWMSEAPRLMASVRIRLTSLTTGACSDSSSRVARSRSSSSSRTSRSLPRLLGEVLHDLLQLDRVGRAVVAVDGAADRRLRRHDRLDLVAGHELHVVHGEDVRGIDHRHGDRGAGLGDRHDGVFAGDVGRNDLDDGVVDLHPHQIDRRDLEVLGERFDELFVGEVPELDEVGAEPAPLVFLEGERLVELSLVDLARLHQQLPELVGDLRLRLRPACRDFRRWCHAQSPIGPGCRPRPSGGRKLSPFNLLKRFAVYQPVGKGVNAA